MDHFVRIIIENNAEFELDEGVFPLHESYESAEDNAKFFEIPLSRELTEQESDEFVEKLAEYLHELGVENFDVEVSTDLDSDIDEITIDDTDDFHEWFGVLGYSESDPLWEAEYQGRKVKLNKPMRGDVKKFKVYVKNPKGNIVKVNFGDPNMRIKKSIPARRRSFRARHNCENPGPKTSARYWSCRAW